MVNIFIMTAALLLVGETNADYTVRCYTSFAPKLNPVCMETRFSCYGAQPYDPCTKDTDCCGRSTQRINYNGMIGMGYMRKPSRGIYEIYNTPYCFNNTKCMLRYSRKQIHHQNYDEPTGSLDSIADVLRDLFQ